MRSVEYQRCFGLLVTLWNSSATERVVLINSGEFFMETILIVVLLVVLLGGGGWNVIGSPSPEAGPSRREGSG